MKCKQQIKIHRRGHLALLASVVMVLSIESVPSGEIVAQPFRITSFVLGDDGTAALQWEGANSNITVQITESLSPPVWQPVPGVEWPVSGTSWSGAIPMDARKGFLRVVTIPDTGSDSVGGTGTDPDAGTDPNPDDGTDPDHDPYMGTAPIPLQSIDLSTLIAQHDPLSDKFLGNCISCHGTRANEVALDGVTPTAHSLMLSFYGRGNDRCITCHYNGPTFTGPDFLTFSAGALRKQVNYEINACTACHSKGSIYALYDRY